MDFEMAFKTTEKKINLDNANYSVSLEPICACLRGYKENNVAGKDPFEFSATVVYYKDGLVAELKGVKADKGTSFCGMRRKICKSLYVTGVDYIIWKRKKGDKEYIIIMNALTGKIEKDFSKVSLF